jgi:SnoaL-like domain
VRQGEYPSADRHQLGAQHVVCKPRVCSRCGTGKHFLLNNTCELDGDTAHSEAYYLFAARNRDETNWIAGGRYFDRLERRAGQWRIALRTNVIEWFGMLPSMPIPFADVPDISANGVPARDQK